MSTKTNTNYDAVCEAIREVHDEVTLWKLSDELVRIAPRGVESVEKVVAEAKARGIPTKSTNTLRLYRDVAIRFPEAKRVPLVSFSAHREAIALGDVNAARKILQDLASKHGPEGVTVTTVKRAIAVQTGKVSGTAAGAKATTTKRLSYTEIAQDLGSGAKELLANLDDMAKTAKLDDMHKGVKKLLVEIERRQMRAARKAATAKPTAKPGAKAPAKKAPAKAPAKAGAKAGDLRGL